jgi:predicted nucleotidyltransferase
MSDTTAQAKTQPVHLDAKTTDDLVSRIVDAVHPLRILVFGSAAQGQMGRDSDIDVMVVMPDGAHCLNTAQHLYQQMIGFSFPVDILVATPAVLEQHKDNRGLIYRTILKEGREIYAA